MPIFCSPSAKGSPTPEADRHGGGGQRQGPAWPRGGSKSDGTTRRARSEGREMRTTTSKENKRREQKKGKKKLATHRRGTARVLFRGGAAGDARECGWGLLAGLAAEAGWWVARRSPRQEGVFLPPFAIILGLLPLPRFTAVTAVVSVARRRVGKIDFLGLCRNRPPSGRRCFPAVQLVF